MSEMNVIDSTGDTKYMWDADNEVEVKAAEATFDKLRSDNYIAYKVNGDGGKGEIITEFDPSLGKIIMIPPVVGG